MTTRSTFTKDRQMTATARAVLDSTTGELAKARAENAQLRRIVDHFLASPRGQQRPAKAISRDVNLALLRKGALPGTRSTATHTQAQIERIKRAAAMLIAEHKAPATVAPVRVGGVVDKVATAIKVAHSSCRKGH